MEQFIAVQTKINESFSASIDLPTSKFDVMATQQKAMDTQIAHIAQQVSNLPRPQGHLPGEPETSPMATSMLYLQQERGFEENPVMVLQESVSVPDSAGADAQKEEGKLSSTGKVNPTPPIHFY